MDWQSIIAAAALATALCGGALTMAGNWIKGEFNELKEARKNGHDDHEKRLDRVEIKSSDFMPKEEILRTVEHEKNNRSQSDKAIERLIGRNTDDISDLKIAHGKLETSFSFLSGQVGELKQMSATTLEKLDKLAAEISRKS